MHQRIRHLHADVARPDNDGRAWISLHQSVMDSKRIVHRVQGKDSRQINAGDFRNERTRSGRDQ